MSRPKKNNKKTWKVTVRFTEHDKTIIKKLTEASGLSDSEIIRAAVLRFEIKPRLTSEEATFFRHLIGVTNNLNQITRGTNQGDQLYNEIQDTNRALRIVLNKLR